MGGTYDGGAYAGTYASTYPAPTQAPTPVPAPTPNLCSGSSGQWEQCGGSSMPVETCCPTGWVCSGDASKQCVPKPCDSSNECQCADAQCGGQSWTGKTCCAEG